MICDQSMLRGSRWAVTLDLLQSKQVLWPLSYEASTDPQRITLWHALLVGDNSTRPVMSAWQDCDTMINLSWEAQGWLWPLFVNIQGTPKGFEEFSNRSWWSPGALSSIDARSDHNHLPRQLSTAFPCHRCDKCGKVFTQPGNRGWDKSTGNANLHLTFISSSKTLH